MYTLSKHASLIRATSIHPSIYGVILPDGENHGITLRCLKQVVIPIAQIPQCRALKHNVLLISLDTLLAQCTESIIGSDLRSALHITPASSVPGQLVAAHSEAR